MLRGSEIWTITCVAAGLLQSFCDSSLFFRHPAVAFGGRSCLELFFSFVSIHMVWGGKETPPGADMCEFTPDALVGSSPALFWRDVWGVSA